jgi:formate/nitrite transporter
VGDTALQVARAKAMLPASDVFARGILCNALVCLAVWLATAGRTVTDKWLAIVFPIAAFVTMGFEHSIANWFFLPYGMMLDANPRMLVDGAARNLLFSTAGNLVGGTLLVAGVYWAAYLRHDRRTPSGGHRH